MTWRKTWRIFRFGVLLERSHRFCVFSPALPQLLPSSCLALSRLFPSSFPTCFPSSSPALAQLWLVASAILLVASDIRSAACCTVVTFSCSRENNCPSPSGRSQLLVVLLSGSFNVTTIVKAQGAYPEAILRGAAGPAGCQKLPGRSPLLALLSSRSV